MAVFCLTRPTPVTWSHYIIIVWFIHLCLPPYNSNLRYFEIKPLVPRTSNLRDSTVVLKVSYHYGPAHECLLQMRLRFACWVIFRALYKWPSLLVRMKWHSFINCFVFVCSVGGGVLLFVLCFYSKYTIFCWKFMQRHRGGKALVPFLRTDPIWYLIEHLSESGYMDIIKKY